MRIGVYFNVPFGGAFHLIENHIKQLSKRHEIFLYSIEIDQSLPDYFGLQYNAEIISPLAKYVRAERKFADPRSANYWYNWVKKNGWGTNKLKIWTKLRDLHLFERNAALVSRAFESDGCDIVIGYIDKFTQVPLPLGKTTLPTVFFCVEPNRSLYDGGNFSRLLTKTHNRFSKRLIEMDRQLADSVRQFACNSYYTRDSIYHAYGKLAWVIPSGVDIKSFYPDPEIKKENLILCVGVLMQHKAPEFLLQSLLHIERSHRPRVAFVYPRGSDAMRSELQAYADVNHLEVEFHARIQTSELRELYNRAKVCAYPPIMEPGGLVPLEAQACGTPIVAVNEGGNREEVLNGITGFLTERDPLEFGTAIERLLYDDALATHMGKAGMEWIRSNWTWEKIALKMEQHLQALVAQQKVRP